MNQRITIVAVVLLLAASVTPVAAVPESGVGTVATVSDDGVAASAAMQSNCSFPVTSTDATGTEVTVESKPERVVTLGPSAAQTMWEIGGKSQVVGLTQYSSYLEGADSRANVSGAGRTYVGVEKVVARDPGLVLAANVVSNETVRKLREAGLTVYKFEEAASIEDIYAKTKLIGRLTGNCEGANETVAWMKDRVSTVREAVRGEDAPRVLVSQGGGWTAGNGTFVGQLVELAGGRNVAAAANISGYKQISGEVVVERNPQWIVQIGQFGVYPKTEAYNSTAAVKRGNVLTVNSNYASQPAPRVVYPIVKMAKAFHPEAYAEANATTTEAATASTATADTTATATEIEAETTAAEGAMQEATTTAATTDSSGGVPGFGVSAALAALAGAALLARRR